jgi:pyroglutamyl-peptidase
LITAGCWPKSGAALLAAVFPARLTTTAGSYLSNPNLYTALGLRAARRPAPACGFIHLPYASEQVAAILQGGKGGLDGESLAPSLPIATMIAAAKIIIEVGLNAKAAPPSSR